MTAHAVDDSASDRVSRIGEGDPWPGLEAFDEASQRFFHGRRQDTAELRRLVLNASLTVLFGASGLGKTSLLHAGLFPLLRQDNVLPVYVRLRLDVREHTRPLMEQVKDAMTEAFRTQQIEAPACGDAESLWECLHWDGFELWSNRNRLLTPLFVFDQFEELFTIGAADPDAIGRFRVDFGDLVENRIPSDLAVRIRDDEAAGASLTFARQPYKVLVSFREDFLPALEGWKHDLPSIMRNRLRLLPMSGDQAFEAVHMTAPHLAEHSIAWEIVRFVAAAKTEGEPESRRDDVAEQDLVVEPALLSLLCHGLNERRKAQGKSAFDRVLLQGAGRAIITDYYDRALAGSPGRVQRFIETELITERGFRKQYDIDDARTLYRLSDEDLRRLVDRRLLRIEPHPQTPRVELAHDLLTGVVREHRDLRRYQLRLRRWVLLSALGLGAVVWAVASSWMYMRANEQVARLEVEQRRLQQQTAALEAKTETLNQAMRDAGTQLAELITATTALEDLIESKQSFLRSLNEARFLIDIRMRFDDVHQALDVLGEIAPALRTARRWRTWVTVLASAKSGSLEPTDEMQRCLKPDDQVAVRATPNGLFALVLVGDGTFTTAYRRTVQFQSEGCVPGAYFADTDGWK